jgi:hypothetical protein
MRKILLVAVGLGLCVPAYHYGIPATGAVVAIYQSSGTPLTSANEPLPPMPETKVKGDMLMAVLKWDETNLVTGPISAQQAWEEVRPPKEAHATVVLEGDPKFYELLERAERARNEASAKPR